jgi:hypothetical protein
MPHTTFLTSKALLVACPATIERILHFQLCGLHHLLLLLHYSLHSHQLLQRLAPVFLVATV